VATIGQVIAPDPLLYRPPFETTTPLKPDGRLADAATLLAGDGPLLVNVIGMFTVPPAPTVGGTVAVVARSAPSARTTSVAFTPLVSILPAGALKLPASVIAYEAGAAAVTLMLIVQLVGPIASAPLARVRTLPATLRLQRAT